MSALITKRASPEGRWKQKLFNLAAGKIAFQGGAAFLNIATGYVEPASSSTGCLYLGTFIESVDASAGSLPVNVDLVQEIVFRRYANATAADAVAATDVGNLAYFMDDQTVCITPAGRSVAGRIWDVDAVKGIAIEKVETSTPALVQPAATTPAAFVANDLVLTSVAQDAVYDVPTTAGVSTVTLPAAAPDGSRVLFAADGTKNGHTVQYRDATGPVALTTALLASKRHLVECVKRGGKWFANAYVSP
jgi:hypothetical protein